jgi:hypothetical protein
VAVAKALGHEHLHRLTEKLGAPVAEDALGLRVDHLDAARGVDHHHRIGRGLDDSPEAFRLPLARRDVDDGGKHHRALLGLDRIEADLDRHLAPVLAQAI